MVLYAELGAIQAVRDPAVRLSSRPTKEWLAAMAALQGHTGRQARLYRGIVGALAIPAAFASLIDDDGTAALAFGAIHNGIICYELVVTDPQRRRRGHARRIIADSRRLGQGTGCHSSLPRGRSRQPAGCGALPSARLSRNLPVPLSTPTLRGLGPACLRIPADRPRPRRPASENGSRAAHSRPESDPDRAFRPVARAAPSSVSASSSAPTCRLKAIKSRANSSLTPGAKYCSEKPRVAFGPSGIQTSIDRLGNPGLIEIVVFGHSRWYCDCVTGPRTS